MRLELEEGNGIAALAKPSTEVRDIARWANGTTVWAGGGVTIAVKDEDWMRQDAVAVTHPANRPIVPMDEAEEARILSHPDVVAAIETVLPEIEAWERA
jgi:hypothetical protein